LQDALKQRKVVVVVGTGVSMATTRDPLATWTGLLENGIEFCKAWMDPDTGWIRRAEDELEAEELLALGSRIAGQLRNAGDSGLFGKWLRSTVAQLRVERHDPKGPLDQSSGLIDALWQLRAPVLTTNYDTLIEDATGAGSATTRTPELIQSVLTGSEPRVVGHLHGVWGDAIQSSFRSSRTGRRREREISRPLFGPPRTR